MYVKSLTLKGFKSFAEPVTLDLQPGVNVVVGPNGSGKSNVIDAVAWVLGAQGARALRGGKMDDVIFAGTGKRTALGRAEVSLTIDNSDNRIPVDFSEVTITRTLFRTGESEYAINGVPCRLLDIQELLSDSGVGRQQHVIVSQGNLDAVLTARPEDRRMIIEEAAGVLKFRKRREKSQRRLESTETNLERLQDLVREVRQQLRPLQKQAEAAMRHGDVMAELRALRLHAAGRDIESLRHRQANAEADASELMQLDAQLRENLVELDTEVTAAEQAVAGLTSEDLGERVERLESAYQRAKGLTALMSERRRSLERLLSAQVSQDVVAQLENDAANVRREIAQVHEERLTLPEPLEALSHLENELAKEWLDFEQEWGEGLPVASNEAGQIRGEAQAIANSVKSLEQEIAKRTERLAQLQQQSEQAHAEADRLRTEGESASAAQAELEATAAACEAASGIAQQSFDESEQTFRAAEQRWSVADARVDALSSALDEVRAKAGVERLSDVGGIVGTLSELVNVADGYQAAFEAAVGESMAAVVVDSVDAARSALAHLRNTDSDGAVLVMGHTHDEPGRAPEGADNVETLRDKVKGTTPAAEALLDEVLCCGVVIDGQWDDAVDFALEYPDLVTVTKQGDRFSRSGWRIGSGSAGATMAAVEAAKEEAETAAAALEDQRAGFDAARQSRDDALAAERAAHQAVIENERRIAQTTSGFERSNGRHEGLLAEIDTIGGNVSELHERLESQQTRLAEIERRLPALEAAEASGVERARLWREARSILEEQSTQLRAQRSELEVKASALEERSQFLERRLDGLSSRLEQHKIEVEKAAERRLATEHSMAVIDRLQAALARTLEALEVDLVDMRALRNAERDRRREVTQRLETARQARSGVERQMLGIAEKKQQHEVRQAEIRMRLESVLETLVRELEVDEQTALDAEAPELPEGKTVKQRIAELDREVRQMGPVNPLALEEYETVKERHEFLDQQLQDVQESRRELLRVIRAVDAEIVDVFKEAYEDVAKNFEQLFSALFPGGAGQLKLTDPDNPLETGIEIEAKPSGKNVRTLSLLSGGERSLVAMGFLFAVFRSRPSPFYLLDEVEAALDDMNLSRFLTLVDEFRNEAQLVIVSHQKRTMEKADCLYGVSMQQGGSSKVVSERVHVDLTAVS